MSNASRKRRAPAWCPQQSANQIRFAQKVNDLFQAGVQLQEQARYHEAIALYKKVASELERARVRDSSIYAAIGHAMLFTGDFKTSLTYSQRSLEIDPKFFKALVNASTACRLLDRINEAYDYAQKAHELEPENAKPLGALAAIHVSRGQTSQGLVRAAYAIRLDPECLDAISAIASAYSRVGDMEMALPYYEKYLEKMPFDAGIASGRLFTLHYKTGITRQELRQAHKEWGDRFASQFKAQWPKHQNEPTTDRKLRIGYISGDFRQHVVGYWTKHIIENHDKSRFEVFCFANNKEDEYSEKFKAGADHWINILDKSDDEVAQLIQEFKIDILIDLSGHTAGHRLLVMARKPAPVQATWCGYIDSTGLEAVDYVITDAVTAPTTEDSPFVEEPLQLRTGSACFDQIPDVPAVGPLPVQRKGYFTFGCFNNPSKVGPEVVELWSRILKAAPGSRLMLTYGNLDDVFTRERLVRLFNEHDIGEDRLQFRKGSRKATLQGYTDEIDVALDTFPYTGGTTTCEALWMGVPVVALYGEFPMSRYSCGLLTYAGLTGLTTNSKDEYVERALYLFRNTETLAYLRANLREHLMKTPLFNPKLFLEGLEEAYVQVFQKWCNQQTTVKEHELVTA